jgi:anaerobic selenocysteine-containing dehydrogenase
MTPTRSVAAQPTQARPGPEVELHPVAAEPRGIANGDWVIETPEGMVRVCVRLNDDLDPGVLVGEHSLHRGKVSPRGVRRAGRQRSPLGFIEPLS